MDCSSYQLRYFSLRYSSQCYSVINFSDLVYKLRGLFWSANFLGQRIAPIKRIAINLLIETNFIRGNFSVMFGVNELARIIIRTQITRIFMNY
jgi:GTP-dependent phosphoenolpyruvate carboxykinase